MSRILLVEDDKDIIKLLSLHLNTSGHEITSCTSGHEAIEKASNSQFNLAILDIMLPDIDGIEICKILREKMIRVPVIMLSARSEEIDKVLALEVGADDYMTKPFSMRELLARVKAHLRRADHINKPPGEVSTGVRFKELLIDKDRRKASINEKRLDLTLKEFDLLLLLAQNPGKTFSRLELLELVWGYTISGYEHTVTSHINRLRLKLEADLNNPRYIITSWGVGYRFSDELQEQ